MPVTTRNLFGSVGLYFEGAYFGFVADGRVYFHTNDETRTAYVACGMTAYQPKSRPRGAKTVDRNFTVPEDVIADSEQLREWALRAVEAAKKN